MSRRAGRHGHAGPLLDIASYARPGPQRRDRLSSAQISQVRRTVVRAPEVMVKVMGGRQSSLSAVRAHLRYLDRKGELEVETDEGRQMRGAQAARELIDDWSLDLDAVRRRSALSAFSRRAPPRLIHRVVFSMPADTDAQRLARAVRRFAQTQFGGQHRYAFVLHTDRPHPHVHMVIKGIGEQGQSLEIRKATLRHWRGEFVRQLDAVGIVANATERAVRGEVKPRLRDRAFRAMRRGASAKLREELADIAARLRSKRPLAENGKATMMETRAEVVRGWRAVEGMLAAQGEQALARRVREFVETMTPVMTQREWLAHRLLQSIHAPRERPVPPKERSVSDAAHRTRS